MGCESVNIYVTGKIHRGWEWEIGEEGGSLGTED